MRKDIQTKFLSWKSNFSENLTYSEFDPLKDKLFENFYCCECALYENKYAYIIGYPKKGSFYKYNKPIKWKKPKLENCSLSYIASYNQPYRKFLNKNLKLHNFIKHNVVYYGEDEVNLDNIKYKIEPINMSEARNESVNMANTDYLFMLDVDTYGAKIEYENILNKYSNLFHHGIFNLRCINSPNNEVTGNSYYFGLKDIFSKNSYNEKFKGFWGEDTEYMFNWSKIGIPVTIVDVDFFRERHPVIKPEDARNNLHLVKQSLLEGRGEYK